MTIRIHTTYTYTYMGKNYTLYINNPEFADEVNKSGLVNNLLRAYYGEGAVPEKQPAPKTTETPKSEPQFHRIITLPKPETRPKNEDEYDPLDGMVYERRINTVWDTSTGEVAAVTQKEVSELIRRSQVK